MMTRDEAAKLLDGNQYRDEGSKELFSKMKESGLVAVFGASDDLTELRGAIDEELGCSSFYIMSDGLLESECSDGDDCPYYKRLTRMAKVITPVWAKDGFSWQYRTDIPHSSFIIYEDEETYCKGIVFALTDVK